jgi:hypothetical protein
MTRAQGIATFRRLVARLHAALGERYGAPGNARTSTVPTAHDALLPAHYRLLVASASGASGMASATLECTFQDAWYRRPEGERRTLHVRRLSEALAGVSTRGRAQSSGYSGAVTETQSIGVDRRSRILQGLGTFAVTCPTKAGSRLPEKRQ